MDIIAFFRDINGVTYYIMAIINAILIFAIIGYLGEKNNEKIVQMGMQVNVPDSNGTINLNTITSEKHSEASIPTVAPTMMNNSLPNNNTNNNYVQDNNVVAQNNIQSNVAVTNNVPVNNTTATPPVISPEMNEIDPNEKAPAVLVINSENTNMPH